jgi:hypothetical protein
MAVVQFGCVGLYARVFDEQEPMRKLKKVDGLRARGVRAPFIAQGFQFDSVKTGSISREDELIVLRLLVPTFTRRTGRERGLSVNTAVSRRMLTTTHRSTSRREVFNCCAAANMRPSKPGSVLRSDDAKSASPATNQTEHDRRAAGVCLRGPRPPSRTSDRADTRPGGCVSGSPGSLQ